MVQHNRTLRTLALLPTVLSLVPACSQTRQNPNTTSGSVNPSAESSLRTVNIPHTGVKWQSIGNCWAYAALGWVESMILRGGSETAPNFSESYMTYRHYEVQLVSLDRDELQTGGSFYEATQLILNFGLMSEADFAPEEASLSRSERQKKATALLNESLKSGPLSESRSEQVIRAELDRAFGVNMSALEKKIIDPETLLISAGRTEKGKLSEVMPRWNDIVWPVNYSEYPRPPSLGIKPSAQFSGVLNDMQKRALKRAMRAMNAGYPVVLNWFVDFNAMTSEGEFSLEKLVESGAGRQGYHSTVLEDYLAEGIDPTTNQPFSTPEGEVSADLKSKAAMFGTLTSFITKNSWGGSERLDRPSYFRDGERGYHKLKSDYLFAFIPEFDEETKEFTGYTTGLNSIIVPPGF